MAVRADSGALETLGAAANRRLPRAFANSCVGFSRAFSLHIRRSAIVMVDSCVDGTDSVGVHNRAGALAPIEETFRVE